METLKLMLNDDPDRKVIKRIEYIELVEIQCFAIRNILNCEILMITPQLAMGISEMSRIFSSSIDEHNNMLLRKLQLKNLGY